MTRLAICLACLAACCLPTPVAAEPAPPLPTGVVVLASPEPIFVGTEITVSSQPLVAFWDKYFGDLFAILDRDDNGVLDRVEAARIPQPAGLLAEFRGDFDNVTADFAPQAEVDRWPDDGHISLDELARYLRHAGVGNVELRTTPVAQGLDTADAGQLFELLASPRGTWDSTSLADAYPRLRRFDLNDDQRLSLAELRLVANAHRSPVGGSTPKDSTAQQQTLRFGSLTNASAASSPSIKLTIRLGASPPASDGFDVLHSIAPAGESWTTGALGKLADSLSCRVGAVRLELHVVRGNGAQDFESARQSLLQQFETDDSDHNQILDQREVQRSTSGNYFPMLMAIADRNADGRLTSPEMNRYLNLQASAAKHGVVVTASDFGSSLVAILDADGDATLSLRELRHGWSRVAGWDRNNDHELSWDEVPHECQLTWSLGRPQSHTTIAPTPKKETAAPLWFSRMDQNRDGDISRREFLGTLAEFRRYDVDGDGLVSPAEADVAMKDRPKN